MSSSPNVFSATRWTSHRTGRSCNIFSPPSARKQFPAAVCDADVSPTSSAVLETPEIVQAPPPLIFTFEDDDACSDLDLETGLGLRLADTTASRNNSLHFGSSASVFSRMGIDAPLPSATSSPSMSGDKAADPLHLRNVSLSLSTRIDSLFTPNLSEMNSRGSRSGILESASVAATYSGSPEADIRLEAFHLYEFSPYIDSPLARDGDASLLPGVSSVDVPTVNVQASVCIDSSHETPCATNRTNNPRLRPLFLPKDLATRQARTPQVLPTSKAFSPRPLMLPQQLARRALHLETQLRETETNVDTATLLDGTSSLSLVPGGYIESTGIKPVQHGLLSSENSYSASQMDLIDWDAVEASAVIMPCYESSPALSAMAGEYAGRNVSV